MITAPKASLSPTTSPTKLKASASAVFFSGGDTSIFTSAINSRSPSPRLGKISKSPTIKIDPASPESNKELSKKENKGTSNRKSRRDLDQRGKGGRKGANILSRDVLRFQSRFIGRPYEYDWELIRRQQAMIAIQPKTGLEEIDERRRTLRIKVEARKRAEALSSSRASTSLGMISTLTTPILTKQRSRSVSRSPSPRFNAFGSISGSGFGGSKGDLRNGQSDFEISKKVADTTSQVIKVTKKVVTRIPAKGPGPVHPVQQGNKQIISKTKN